MNETGNKGGQSRCYGFLGNLFCSLGEYAKAAECLEKALAMMKVIGDRVGQAAAYNVLGNLFSFFLNMTKLMNV